MLCKIEGRKRRGRQRIRLLDGITDSVDTGSGGLRPIKTPSGTFHPPGFTPGLPGGVLSPGFPDLHPVASLLSLNRRLGQPLEGKEIKSSHLLLPSDSSLLLLYVRQGENLIPCQRP